MTITAVTVKALVDIAKTRIQKVSIDLPVYSGPLSVRMRQEKVLRRCIYSAREAFTGDGARWAPDAVIDFDDRDGRLNCD